LPAETLVGTTRLTVRVFPAAVIESVLEPGVSLATPPSAPPDDDEPLPDAPELDVEEPPLDDPPEEPPPDDVDEPPEDEPSGEASPHARARVEAERTARAATRWRDAIGRSKAKRTNPS
jgi:hypothetical protein